MKNWKKTIFSYIFWCVQLCMCVYLCGKWAQHSSKKNLQKNNEWLKFSGLNITYSHFHVFITLQVHNNTTHKAYTHCKNMKNKFFYILVVSRCSIFRLFAWKQIKNKTADLYNNNNCVAAKFHQFLKAEKYETTIEVISLWDIVPINIYYVCILSLSFVEI